MKKPTVREIRQLLQQKSQEQIIEDMIFLYTKFDGVKEFIALQMGHSFSDDLLEKHRTIIQREFFPARGYGRARLSIARKAVTDYKKLSPNIPGLIDLMVFYVEMGVQFTNAYGDISEAFYSSMESMYGNALKHITRYQLIDQFQDRCKEIVIDTRNIGWGFHDNLSILYDETFEEGDEDEGDEDDEAPVKESYND
jgi:hypothetical protein